MDQAAKLRELVNKRANTTERKPLKVITVTSGKGGVGKSNFTVNLALALKEQGRNPLILDADFGLSNVEVLLGEHVKSNMSSVIKGNKTLEEIVVESQHGIKFISGGSGITDMMFLKSEELDRIVGEIGKIENIADTLIIDTGAGINETVIKFSMLAEEICLVVTPEPTSITDSYALVKTLVVNYNIGNKMSVIVNKADSRAEAQDVYNKLQKVCHSFLSYDVRYAGFIPFDMSVIKAGKAQTPLVIHNKKSVSASAFRDIAKMILNNVEGSEQKVSWLGKLHSIFQKR